MPNKADAIAYITAAYPTLTEGERQIADYLIAHLQNALLLGVHQLAKECGVSMATVTRYAQHMGFDGYKAFRLYLAQNMSGGEDFFLEIPQTAGDLVNQVNRVLNASTEALRLTKEEMDYGALTAVAETLCGARQLLFFGTGTSSIVCEDAVLKYKRYGKTANAASDLYAAALNLAAMSERDLLVVVSHAGQNADALKVLKTAKKIGVQTLAVTTYSQSPVAVEAGRVLVTQTRESPYHNVAISSRISQFAMMDALFAAFLTVEYNTCAQSNDRLRRLLKELNLV